MHGGVILTMAAVRENYWITKLRQLTERVTRNCFGCKRFQVKPLQHLHKARYQLIELWN